MTLRAVYPEEMVPGCEYVARLRVDFEVERAGVFVCRDYARGVRSTCQFTDVSYPDSDDVLRDIHFPMNMNYFYEVVE